MKKIFEILWKKNKKMFLCNKNCFLKYINKIKNGKYLFYRNTYKYGKYKNNMGCPCILDNLDKKKYEFIIYDRLNHNTQRYSDKEYVIEIIKK